MMTRNEIIENRIFTEDQLKRLINKCCEWYTSYMGLKFTNYSGEAAELALEMDQAKIDIYMRCFLTT